MMVYAASPVKRRRATRDEMEERALPYTGRADDGNQLALLDLKRQIAQNVEPLCADDVGFVDVGCRQEGHRVTSEL